MATFTVVFKYACDIVHATEENAYAPIGLGEYPIFDEPYRATLNKKIVDRYWNREIGMESIEMFTFAMKRKLNEIMPYYNKLYETEKIEFDPLITMDINTVASSTIIEDATANTDTTSDTTSGTLEDANATTDAHSDTVGDAHSRAVQSTTPQTMLSGMEDYASSASDSNSDSDTISDSNQVTDQTTQTDTEIGTVANQITDQNTQRDTDANSHVTGYQGIPSNIIIAYRASLLNIDLLILADLEELFMLVWDTGDEYARRDHYLNWYV
jgi:hypothetical protein